jgi:eukaryotic-like serine/threonine-protein kinase
MTLDTIRPERDIAARDDPRSDDDTFDRLLARIAEAPDVPLDPLLKPGTEVSGFRVVEAIGQGAFGTVYRAVHSLIGKEVALKVLSKAHAHNPLMVRRFVEEARAVSRIHHPSIVDIFGFGELHDGTPYIVMELLQGRSLCELLREREVLPIERVVAVLGEVASALEAAHRAGILHRDLKPSNVFLTGDIDGEFNAKLLDFGIAKFLDGSTQMTEAGTLIGTPGYMSPEQCAGEPLANTSDIYALGVLSFELLTGRHPFPRGNNARMLVQHLVEVPPRVSEIANHLPCALDAPVAAMLEKDPARRPQSATEAVEGLRRALAVPRAARRAFWQKPGAAAGRWPAGRWRTYTLVALGLLVPVSIGAWMAAPKAEPEKALAIPLSAPASPAPAPIPAPVIARAVAPNDTTRPLPEANDVEVSPSAPSGTKKPTLEKRAAKPVRRRVSARGELEF